MLSSCELMKANVMCFQNLMVGQAEGILTAKERKRKEGKKSKQSQFPSNPHIFMLRKILTFILCLQTQWGGLLLQLC